MSLLMVDMDGRIREPLSGQQYFQLSPRGDSIHNYKVEKIPLELRFPSHRDYICLLY